MITRHAHVKAEAVKLSKFSRVQVLAGQVAPVTVVQLKWFPDRSDTATMQSIAVSATISPRFRAISMLPLGLMLLVAVLSATGWQLVPVSSAVSSNVDVEVEVAKEVHIAFSSGNCRGSGGTDGLLDGVTLNVSNNDTVLGSCSVTFGTNNSVSGALLNIASANAGANNFFCMRSSFVGACGSGSFTDGSGADLPEGSVGGKLVSATGCTSSGWTSGAYGSVLAAGTNVCSTSSTSDATYAFQLAADPSPTQPAGTYRGRAVLTATAL